MRKTKIICTLGPATDDENVLRDMMLAGMNVARFNFSHGDYTSHLTRLQQVINMRDALQLPVATLLDTKGPEIRLKKFVNGFTVVEKGALFTLTSAERIGDETGCSITYKHLPKDVSPGVQILLDDGLISMVVQETTENSIVCRVENGGKLKDNKGINVPGVCLSMPYVSEQDKQDILFGIAHCFDFIACSFVRSAQDIFDVRKILDSEKCDTIRIISKIENAEGVANIDEIIAVSDGIMIARGDMGVEIDFTQIPAIQKKLISACYTSGKPAITATQMLESMIENPRPTRAETTDVANAIYDGTSAIMLSGETAAGKYPVAAVQTMAAIASQTEQNINYKQRFYSFETSQNLNVANAVSHAACSTALDISAKAIITVSKSGETARYISKWRPEVPIVACVTDPHVLRQLALSWGVVPVIVKDAHSTDELFEISMEAAKQTGVVQDGDFVVTTAGVPIGISGTTNILKADIVGDILAAGTGLGNVPATGKLCVCPDNNQIAFRFQTNDILVLTHATEELLPYMEQAAAVIVEEDGVNSYAAITCLSLDIPVIVGSENATKKLRNGVIATVDPERGVIRSAALATN